MQQMLEDLSVRLAALEAAHITVNKNGIPFDPEKPTVTSGIRLGTPAGTTRGFGVAEFREVGNLICDVLDALANNRPTSVYILTWAVIGIIGIIASVVVSVAADRMAHRCRLGAMAEAFDKAITLPISTSSSAATWLCPQCRQNSASAAMDW